MTSAAVALAALAALAAVAAAAGGAKDEDIGDIKLAFSGGGNRACLGTNTVLEWLEELNDLGAVSRISSLSGGTWGTTMFALADYGRKGNADAAAASRTERSRKRFFGGKDGRAWGDMKRFSRMDSLLRKRDKLYKNWRDDITDAVLHDPLTMKWAAVGERMRKTHRNIPLCSLISDGPDMDNPKRTCAMCTDKATATCWETSSNPFGHRRSDVNLFAANSRVEKSRIAGGMATRDVMALTSSAWTFIAKPLEVEAGGQTLEVSDAGIDCNIPLMPEWARPAEKRSAVLMFDFSDNGSNTFQGLDHCLEKWRERYGIHLTKEPVTLRTTKLTPDGFMATKEQVAAHRAKGMAHLVKSSVVRLKQPSGSVAEGKKPVELYWIYFRGITGDDAALIKKHPTLSAFAPASYHLEKFESIEKEYYTYLRQSVEPVLKRLNVLFNDLSPVGFGKLFAEG